MAEKILIVDDDPDTVKFLGTMLKRLGYEPLAAPDGISALKKAHEARPDLIVLDVMMPGMDGFEVARSLRRHPETALIPILMFTAKTQVDDKLAGYESGVDIYLTKPIHPVELQANIKALLSKKRTRADALADKGYVVGVIAAKGGQGVSTVALNLAVSYKQRHKDKVVAAEMRPGQGSWASELGIGLDSGLATLLQQSQTEITPAAVERELVATTFGVPLLLASNKSCDAECMAALAQYEVVVGQLASMAALVVLDIGTNFHPAFNILTKYCDELIVITEPQPLAVKRTRALIDELKMLDYGSAKALTVVTVNHTRAEMMLTVSQIEEALKQSVALGFPPATELAYLAATQATPMVLQQQDGIINQQFAVLTDNLAQHVEDSKGT